MFSFLLQYLVNLQSPAGYGSDDYSTDTSNGYLSSPNYIWPRDSHPSPGYDFFPYQTQYNFHHTPWIGSPGSDGGGNSESEGSVTFEPETHHHKSLYHHQGFPAKRELKLEHRHQSCVHNGEMVVPVIPPKRKRGRPKKIRIEKPSTYKPDSVINI